MDDLDEIDELPDALAEYAEDNNLTNIGWKRIEIRHGDQLVLVDNQLFPANNPSLILSHRATSEDGSYHYYAGKHDLPLNEGPLWFWEEVPDAVKREGQEEDQDR